MDIIEINPEKLDSAIQLLRENALPSEDITPDIKLFALQESGKILGIVGIQSGAGMCLLRSLCVEAKERGRGTGKKLVAFIHSYAKDNKIKEVYLLTTTARAFFAGLGYMVIERSFVPDFIRETSEFKGVCPASAIAMKKTL